VAVVAGFLLIAYVVLKLAPDWFAETNGLDAKGRADARQAVRTASLALLAGTVGVIGAVYTARTFSLNRAGQLTDRFTKAIEQLGHAQLDVRLGGIYALERIARDSREDHPQVVEVLTAYVREHAPKKLEREPELPGPFFGWRQATDVQAVLTVLGRRSLAHERDAPARLNLAFTELRRARLTGANLRRANLTRASLEEAWAAGADLAEAFLVLTDLTRAELNEADLSKARLNGAYLEGAKLARAHLSGAILEHANLTEADLSDADLTEAHLPTANLTKAHLNGADLTAADLTEANLTKADLTDANLNGARLSGADLTKANPIGANLRGAVYDGATSWPKHFDPVSAGAYDEGTLNRAADDTAGDVREPRPEVAENPEAGA
jgi:hypothetical protein